MFDYTPYQERVLAMITDKGGPLTWTQKEAGSPIDPDKPWKKTAATEAAHPVVACTFAASEGRVSLFDADFEEGTTVETAYRYLIIAGEGRTIRPHTGDTFGLIEGKNAVAVGVSVLDPNNSGHYILYEVGVKL